MSSQKWQFFEAKEHSLQNFSMDHRKILCHIYYIFSLLDLKYIRIAIYIRTKCIRISSHLKQNFSQEYERYGVEVSFKEYKNKIPCLEGSKWAHYTGKFLCKEFCPKVKCGVYYTMISITFNLIPTQYWSKTHKLWSTSLHTKYFMSVSLKHIRSSSFN